MYDVQELLVSNDDHQQVFESEDDEPILYAPSPREGTFQDEDHPYTRVLQGIHDSEDQVCLKNEALETLLSRFKLEAPSRLGQGDSRNLCSSCRKIDFDTILHVRISGQCYRQTSIPSKFH
jgi:hypothetical protein